MKKFSTLLIAFLMIGVFAANAQKYTSNQTLTGPEHYTPTWKTGITITIPSNANVTFDGGGGEGTLIVNGTLNITTKFQITGDLVLGPNAHLTVNGNFVTGSTVLYGVNSIIQINGDYSPYGKKEIELANGAHLNVTGNAVYNSGFLHMDDGSFSTVGGDMNLSNPNNYIAGNLSVGGTLTFNQPVTTMACPGMITTKGLANGSAEFAIDGAGFLKVTGTFTSGNALTNSAAIILNLANPVGSEKIGKATLGTASTCIITLPIFLSDFSAAVSGSIVKLNWKTTTEVNNQQFVVERSVDGINYQSVATVASKAPNGTSTKDIAYEATDNSPVNGSNIYRLKQIDLNGKTTYYNLTTTVNFISTGVLSVYPNPASSYIQVKGGQSGDHYTVYSVSGAKVLSAETSRIDITSLANGLYFIQVIRSGKVVNTSKFLKH